MYADSVYFIKGLEAACIISVPEDGQNEQVIFYIRYYCDIGSLADIGGKRRRSGLSSKGWLLRGGRYGTESIMFD